MHDIIVFGDSHMRNFFGQTNHGSEPLIVEVDGKYRFIDRLVGTSAGATIYGLLNPNSKIGLRNKILSQLEKDNQNVAFILGEVDQRYHILGRLNGRTISETVAEVISRYEEFLTKEVVPKISGKILIWTATPYSYKYFSQTMDTEKQRLMKEVIPEFEKQIVQMCEKNGWHAIKTLETIANPEYCLHEKYWTDPNQPLEEVHLNPKAVFDDVVLPQVRQIFG